MGKQIVEDHRLPKFKRTRMSVKPNHANVAAKSLRNKGLVAQERRIGL